MTLIRNIRNTYNRVQELPPNVLFAICFLLTFFIGYLDYLTGSEINFFIFYGIPIWFSTWHLGNKRGLALAVLSTLIWFFVELIPSKEYMNSFTPYWNGSVRFCFFLFIIYSLKNIRQKLELEELNADHDYLTGILNARGFKGRLSILFPLLRRNKQKYVIGFIDLDNFKKLNDSKGHAEGDKALKVVSKVIKECLRRSDLVGRFGGDEFLVFLGDSDLEHAKIAISKLKAELDGSMQENGWPIGFSMGICSFDSLKTETEDAIELADSLMYEVKSSNKGEVFYKKYYY